MWYTAPDRDRGNRQCAILRHVQFWDTNLIFSESNVMNYDAKSNQYLQGKQDCAIVSIANLLKIDYARVINALYSVGGIEAIDRLNTKGVTSDNLKLTLEYLTKRNWVVKTPRRGQEKFIGIASWHHANKSMGHANIIKYGNVYETNGYVYTLEQYRLRTKMVMRAIYAPVA